MNALRIVQRIASFFTVVSAIFVALSAASTYFLLQITSLGAPNEYIALYILTTVMPFLFMMMLSLVVAVLTSRIDKTKEKAAETEANNVEGSFKEENA